MKKMEEKDQTPTIEIGNTKAIAKDDVVKYRL